MRTTATPILAALLVAVASCKRDGAATAKDDRAQADACAALPKAGWLEWVATDPEAPGALQGAGGGWISMYERDYRDAVEKFQAAAEGDDPRAAAGLARAHLRLGVLNLALARLTAHAQARYFERRAALGARAEPLPQAPYFRAIAEALSEDVEAARAGLATVAEKGPKPLRALAEGWRVGCDASSKGKDALAVVAQHALCPAATCPEGAEPPSTLDEAWTARVRLYHAALCADPASVDEAALAELAASPAGTDPLKKGEVETEVEYWDPVAPWALGRLHLRRAEAVARAAEMELLAAWAAAARGREPDAVDEPAGGDPSWLILSDFLDEAALSAHLTGDARRGLAATEALAEAQSAAERANEAVACRGTSEGKKIIEELDLARAPADGSVRRRAHGILSEETCADALRLLRATQDPEVTDAISFRNEPAFLVRLASAALCMGRTAEAIGALRAVRASYPEAAGALAAVQGVAVVRLMGGTGGTQKTQ